jgi:hypothetical protein
MKTLIIIIKCFNSFVILIITKKPFVAALMENHIWVILGMKKIKRGLKQRHEHLNKCLNATTVIKSTNPYPLVGYVHIVI